MGGLAVLHHQDCIKDHLPRQRTLISSHTKPHRHNNPTANSDPTRSNRRKRSPQKGNYNKRHVMEDDFPVKNLIMRQVKILKRGEEITEPNDLAGEKKARNLEDLVLSQTPGKPESGSPKQMRIGDFYAGSAITLSPPASSLPLPAFFAKINNDASVYLRRLLRLDLL